MSATDPIRETRHSGLSDYLAAERTLLAWIRTGLALMGFGFVVARFGLFLQQLRVIEPSSHVSSYGFSIWLGTALIAAGVALDAFASWHYERLIRQLNRGEEISADHQLRGWLSPSFWPAWEWPWRSI